MGGGDLNAKKAWHPNTIKNQERVWKAEQAAAEEKKRIVELERERQLERERASLNKLARSNAGPSDAGNDDRLHWMYEKPDKKVQDEEYLLGKAIDKNHEQSGKSEVDEIPAISRRVVGSSMLSISGDAQVDLARKMREDPLLLVKERERAARAALLNNPVQRARLAELLRKERKDQETLKEGKPKKDKKKNKNLDNILAEKLQSLSGNKGIDLTSLLASDDSSSESSNAESTKKKKKKSKKKTKKKRNSSNDCESESEVYEKTKAVKKKESKERREDKKRKVRNKSEEDESCSKKKKRNKSVTKINVHSQYNESSDQSSDDGHLSKNKQTMRADNRYEGDQRRRDDRSTREDRHSKGERQTKDYRCTIDERLSKGDRHTKEDLKIRSTRQSSEDRHREDRYTKEDRKIRSTRHSSEDRHREDRYTKEDQKIRSTRHSSEDRHREDRYTQEDRNRRESHKVKNQRNRVYPYKKDDAMPNYKEGKEKHSGLSEEEKAAKLAEMAAAGAEREKQRERRVAQQLLEKDKADRAPTHNRSRNVVNQLPDSLESRIHSNRHYIQRDQRHMNEHFARR